MSNKIDFHIPELDSMKKYPDDIYYIGDTSLLNKRKVSIVGTRKPNQYCKKITYKIASELSKRDICIVSGVAIGVDAIAHQASGSNNTIAVVANGLDIKYPAINSKLIKSIEKKGLVLSSYKNGEKARNYTFVQRNEIVVSLGEILIVSQADEKSGTLSSINYALKMGKKVYTIPHHLGDSLGTQNLLAKGLITPIYDLDEFINSFGKLQDKEIKKDDFFNKNPSYDEALKKFGSKLFEMELEGKIKVENGFVKKI